MAKEKKGFAEFTSPEEKDSEEYKLKKEQIKQEERNIKSAEEQIRLLEQKYERGRKEVDLVKEEIELKMKLYEEHGEDYVNTPEWKKFVLKGLKFELQKNKDQKKNMENGYKLQRNNLISQNDTRKNIIKELKSRCKELKKNIEWSNKESKKIYN